MRGSYTIDDRGLGGSKAKSSGGRDSSSRRARSLLTTTATVSAGPRAKTGVMTRRCASSQPHRRPPGALHLKGLREIAASTAANSADPEPEPRNREYRADRTRADRRAGRDHGLDTYRTAAAASARAGLRRPADLQPGDGRSRRYLPELLRKVELLLDRTGLRDAQIGLRISGCPNGCSRPYLGEIAGRQAPGRYNLMLGADARGQRLNTLHRENIDEAEILGALEPMFVRYTAERANGEAFGDFLLRSGVVAAARAAIPITLETRT